MKSCLIISIVYLEPEWIETKRCIDKSGFPVHYVERKPMGVGYLAEAINRGFRESNAIQYQYAWIVTNITFAPGVPGRLLKSMDRYDVIHPAFNSDHIHERPDGSGVVKPVPFVEFTAAMVRAEVFKDYPLDENLPYWGHDLDHGYRMWQNGYKVGVDHGCIIGHTYIRNKESHPITVQRKRLRKLTDYKTRLHLEKKYGKEWREIIFPKTEKQIGRFYEQVKSKCFL